jgi:hypothetical protein
MRAVARGAIDHRRQWRRGAAAREHLELEAGRVDSLRAGERIVDRAIGRLRHHGINEQADEPGRSQGAQPPQRGPDHAPAPGLGGARLSRHAGARSTAAG